MIFTRKTAGGHTPTLIALRRITCSALLFEGYQLSWAEIGEMEETLTCCGATGASVNKH